MKKFLFLFALAVMPFISFSQTTLATYHNMTDIWLRVDENEALKADLASPTFTGTVVIPSPFTLGATSVTITGAELNLYGAMNNAAIDSLADLSAAEVDLLDGATSLMDLANLDVDSITFDSAASIYNSYTDTLQITETAVSVHGALHATGAITSDGNCCADYAITDYQPPLLEYWAKTVELNRLPAFEGVDRRNLQEHIKGVEESTERLLRYIVAQETRIQELEARLEK